MGTVTGSAPIPQAVAQRALERNLTRRGAQQVSPANNLRDALFGIIDDNRELICELAVRALDDEIACCR